MSENLKDVLQADWDCSHECLCDKAAAEIARLREALVMTDNRLEAVLLGDDVCKSCVEVAKSYCEEALAPRPPEGKEG